MKLWGICLVKNAFDVIACLHRHMPAVCFGCGNMTKVSSVSSSSACHFISIIIKLAVWYLHAFSSKARQKHVSFTCTEHDTLWFVKHGIFLRRVIWVSPLTPVWMSSSQNLQDNDKVSIFMLHFFPTKTNQRFFNVSAIAHIWKSKPKSGWKFPFKLRVFGGPQISLYNWVNHKWANEQEPEGEWSAMPTWY